MDTEHRPSYRCSFCGKTQLEAGLLIGSADRPGEEKVCICRECVASCNEMIADHRRKVAGA